MATVFSISSHMTTVFQRYRVASAERNFIEQIKTPIFFEAVSAIQII